MVPGPGLGAIIAEAAQGLGEEGRAVETPGDALRAFDRRAGKGLGE